MGQWDTTYTMITALLAIFAVVGIGAAARRANWLTEQADQTLFALVIRVLLPALILDNVIGNPALSEARNLWLPPLVGAGTVLLGFAVAAAVARLMGRSLGLTTAPQRRTFALCTGVYNYGYVPLPLAVALFDQRTVGVLFVHNLGVEITLWTVGLLVVSGGMAQGWWRRLLNPPIVAIAAALVLNGVGAERAIPGFVSEVLSMLGVCAIPMALLLIGATVYDNLRDARLTSGLRVIIASSALRLGLLPIAFLALAWVVPGSVELKRVMVLEAAMPAAVFPIVLARLYFGDVATAVRIAIGTSLLSLLTMPLWLGAGLYLLDLTVP